MCLPLSSAGVNPMACEQGMLLPLHHLPAAAVLVCRAFLLGFPGGRGQTRWALSHAVNSMPAEHDTSPCDGMERGPRRTSLGGFISWLFAPLQSLNL